MRPLLLLEMNEIPWRVVDLYKEDPRFPSLRRFFAESATYTTIAADSGELSPWVTWPTLHRGMPNDEHGIYNLGQDPATFKGVPLWEEYRSRGLSIGVCGSLQSWPPMDPGAGGFYIPDTFAHDSKCVPEWVEPFQEFNLAQVKRNGRVVQSRFGIKEVLRLLVSLPRLGVGVATLGAVFGQLLGERFDRNRLARRAIFQTVLLWDVFKGLYKPADPPAFSSFFTNHVAGVMHRYWHHVFPEDFGDRYAGRPRPHKSTMDFAMGYVDRILADAMRFQERNPELVVVFASSMGQAAVLRDEHEGVEASVPNPEKLMHALGISQNDYRPLLAMVPQVAVEIRDDRIRGATHQAIEACTTDSGAPLFSVQEIGASLSITILTPRLKDIRKGGFTDGNGARHSWEAAGIAMNPVHPGTAYHIPEGTLALRGRGIKGSDSRTEIPAPKVKALLMEAAGVG
jgi:hypothetical protein